MVNGVGMVRWGGRHICGPYMRGAGEGAAARRVPGAVKTAPYKAPVNVSP